MKLRQELWEIACALNPRHQSQLRLLAVQARRAALGTLPFRSDARRWWWFEADYMHPVQFPAGLRAAENASVLGEG